MKKHLFLLSALSLTLVACEQDHRTTTETRTDTRTNQPRGTADQQRTDTTRTDNINR